MILSSLAFAIFFAFSIIVGVISTQITFNHKKCIAIVVLPVPHPTSNTLFFLKKYSFNTSSSESQNQSSALAT